MRRGRPPYPDVLTPREQEVLALIREGLTNEQIGARLGISEHGAKYHVAEILSKLGVSSRQEAARWSQPQRVAPGLVALLSRHLAVGALVITGVGLVALAAGVLLMNERSGGATTGSGQQSQPEETLPPAPGIDDGPVRRIAYVEMRGEEGDIWTMNPDGSDKVQLTSDPGIEGSPAWSLDGRRIAFVSGDASAGNSVSLWLMNADGSDRRYVVSITGGASNLHWSPDHRRIAFNSSNPGSPNAFVVNTDGSGLTRVSEGLVNSVQGWSSDGLIILFRGQRGIHAVRPDGSNSRLVLPINVDAGESGDISPDLKTALVAITHDRQFGPVTLEHRTLPNGPNRALFQSATDINHFSLSPAGSSVAFIEDRNGARELKVADVSGNRPVALLLTLPELSGVQGPVQWTSDSSYLVYTRQDSIARFEYQYRVCYAAVDGATNQCFAPIFAHLADGPTSPSLLLN